MKITTDWLKDHLETEFNENQIIDKLTDVGLEVESVEKQSDELDSFVVAKIIKAEKHPNADRLRVCDVDIGSGKPVKVVCGAPHTTFTGFPDPISTSQTLSLSALGCFSALMIFATTKLSSSSDCFSTLSTSKPTSVSLSII